MEFGGNACYSWCTTQLEVELRACFRRLGRPLLCFMDALNEGGENDSRDMIWLFEDSIMVAKATVSVRVCVSSRHYPSISITLGTRFLLDDQDGHNRNINTYIDKKLKIVSSNEALAINQRFDEEPAVFSCGWY